jgi:L-fuculose-phosphate aldolase
MNIIYPSAADARTAIIDTGRRMYERGFVASNDGNISVRISDNLILITPTGVSKGEMTPDMLVILDLDGNIIDGSRKVSSETAMHLRLYRENIAIGAVTHAHPAAATAFAIARIPLDKPVYPEALVILGEVPVASYATPGTSEVPESVAPYANTHRAVLLANHGALTWGKDLHEAWFRLESLENYAKILMYSRFILKAAEELTPDEQNKVLIAAGEGARVKNNN